MTKATDETTATQGGPDLGALFAQFDEYMSFSPEEWALAAAARHRAALEEIQALCDLRPCERSDRRLMEGRINRAAQLSSAVDIDLDADIAWMTARRAASQQKICENAGDADREHVMT